MKQFYLLFLATGFAQISTGMEAPQKTSDLSKRELETCTIIGQRTGNIDDECQTTAVFFEEGKPQAKITYTLQGRNHGRAPAYYNGPAQHLNNCFLGRIISLERIDPNAPQLGLYVLPAFAIHNLKELHKKQNTNSCIEDKNLYIDALLDPQNLFVRMYHYLFGFEKVDNGNFSDIYLLDPLNQTKFAYRCDNLLLPPSSITIEEKPDQKTETLQKEYGSLQKFLAEKQTESKTARPEDSKGITPADGAITSSSTIFTPTPAAATPIIAAFAHAIPTVPQVIPKIRKSSRNISHKKAVCKSGACPIHDLHKHTK